MSPPLVVAFALAGRVGIDLTTEPLGQGSDGTPVFLRDIWPSLQEVREHMESGLSPEIFTRLYQGFAEQNPMWNDVHAPSGTVYDWNPRNRHSSSIFR